MPTLDELQTKYGDKEIESVSAKTHESNNAGSKKNPRMPPKRIIRLLSFMLYSERSKWKNKSETHLLQVKELGEYFGIDPTVKPKIEFTKSKQD